MSRKKKTQLVPHFQDFTRLDSTGCTIRCLVGGRDIGKTWGIRSKIIDVVASGRKFIYVRKNHSMITINKNRTLFVKQDKECMEKLGSVIDFSKAEMAFVLQSTGEVIGWASSLQDAYNVKGTEFPGTKLIFYDEFLDDAPMMNEFASFQRLIGTLTKSYDDIIVYMATNTVTRDNTYFRNFGFDVSKMRPGDIAVVNHIMGATVAMEYCRSSVFIEPETGLAKNHYVGFDHSDETRMIMFGEWTHPPIETREIDGITWASARVVIPALVYLAGKFYELSIASSGQVAFVRVINSQPDRIGSHFHRVITSEFHNTFKHADGTIVPKYLTFASTGSEVLINAIRSFKQYRSAGRIIGLDPVDTHDFLRYFDTMPV